MRGTVKKTPSVPLPSKAPDPVLNLHKAPLAQVVNNLGKASGLNPQEQRNRALEISVGPKR